MLLQNLLVKKMQTYLGDKYIINSTPHLYTLEIYPKINLILIQNNQFERPSNIPQLSHGLQVTKQKSIWVDRFYLEDHPMTRKYLATMVIVSPLNGVVPLPNDLSLHGL